MSRSIQKGDHIYDDGDEDSMEKLGLLAGVSSPVVIDFVGVKPVKGTSWWVSVFLVVNAALGAGLLNFPASYNEAGGVAISSSIQAVFLVFIMIALLVLAYCSDIENSDNYQDVMKSMCGPTAQLCSAFFLSVYCFGTCITFFIIIGDQWEEFFLFVVRDYYCTYNPWYMTRAMTISVTSFLLILPLCFPKRIDFLKYVSAVGVFGILYVAVMVGVKYFMHHDPPPHIKTRPDSWMDVFLVIPIICFSYQCHVSVIPIYSCIEDRCMKTFSKTISVAIFICVLVYSVTATCGYLMFGTTITSDILLSFDPDPEVIVAVILIAIKTYATYPILLFCGRSALLSIWVKLWRIHPAAIESGERRRRIVSTVVWFLVSLVLALFIPNIGVVIAILGALSGFFIFIFPGMCMLKTPDKKNHGNKTLTTRDKCMMGMGIFFIVMGTFIFGLTLSQAIVQDVLKGNIKPDHSKYTCPT